MLNIYKTVIRLKSQVLSKEGSRLVTDIHSVFFAQAQSPWNTVQMCSPPELPEGPKSPPHIFFVLTNLDCFDLGTSLKIHVLSQGSDIACTYRSLAKGNIHF